jgi:hypothetical protein
MNRQARCRLASSSPIRLSQNFLMCDLNHTAFQSDPLSFACAIRTVCGLRNISARLASD